MKNTRTKASTQITLSPAELRQHFCEYVLDWKRTGKLELFIEPDPVGHPDVGVFASDIFERLVDADDSAPNEIAEALGLPAGASYAAATVPVITAWNEPQVLTPEEEAEEEMDLLRMSETFEWFNERNPDMPQIPIVYSKATRRRQ